MQSVIIAFMYFVNPFILGRVFWGSDVLTLVILFFFSFNLIKVHSRPSLKVSKVKVYIFSCLSFYYLFSFGIRVSVGQGFGDLSLFLYQYISLSLLLCLNFDKVLVKRIYWAMLIALIGHVWTILPFLPLNGFLSERLSSLTAYAAGEYSIGSLTRRATGFFPAPGYLSLYVSMTLYTGVFLALKKTNRFNIGIVTLSCIAGFASFSRTFLVISVLLSIYVVIFSKVKMKLGLSFLVICLTLLLGSTSLFKDYDDFVGNRLAKVSDLSTNDRFVGETGVVMTLSSINENLFFGSASSINGGDIKAQVSGVLIRPHFGILALIAFYGIFISSSLLCLIIIAFFKNAIIIMKLNGELDNVALPFSAGYMSAFAICLVEPLLDTNLPLFYMIVSLVLLSKNPKFRNQF